MIVRYLNRTFNDHALFFEQQTLSEVFRVHVGITRHQSRSGGSRQFTNIKASFRGVRTSECHKYTAKLHTSSDIYPCLVDNSFIPALDTTAPTSLSPTSPRPLLIATKTVPDVCLHTSLLAFSEVILTVDAANLNLFLVSVEMLLHPPRRCQRYLCTSSCASRCSTQNHSTRRISMFLMAFAAFHSCSLFSHIFETSL